MYILIIDDPPAGVVVAMSLIDTVAIVLVAEAVVMILVVFGAIVAGVISLVDEVGSTGARNCIPQIIELHKYPLCQQEFLFIYIKLHYDLFGIKSS